MFTINDLKFHEIIFKKINYPCLETKICKQKSIIIYILAL